LEGLLCNGYLLAKGCHVMVHGALLPKVEGEKAFFVDNWEYLWYQFYGFLCKMLNLLNGTYNFGAARFYLAKDFSSSDDDN
jgi:hypothetical protein